MPGTPRSTTRSISGRRHTDIYESGAYRGKRPLSASATGSRIEPGRRHVVYKKNGTIFYTSTVLSTGELRVDTSLYTGRDAGGCCPVGGGGAAKPVQWVNEVGVAVGNLGQRRRSWATSTAMAGGRRAGTADGRLWVRQGRQMDRSGNGGAGHRHRRLNNLHKIATGQWDMPGRRRRSPTAAGFVETVAPRLPHIA